MRQSRKIAESKRKIAKKVKSESIISKEKM